MEVLRSRSGVEVRAHTGKASGDLRDWRSVRVLLGAYRPDVILHLAGKATVKEGEDPSACTAHNTLVTHNLLAHCSAGVRFVFTSSATVYGTCWDKPHAEGDDCRPNSAYGASKVACEWLLQTYGRLGAVKPVVVRLAAQVGLGATHGLLLDLVRKLADGGDNLNLIGHPPGSVKPFTHVRDTAGFLVKLALDSSWEGVVNVSGEGSLSVKEVAELVMGRVGVVKPVVWLGEGANWPGDDPVVRLNTTRAGLLGWEPKYGTSGEAVRQAAGELWDYHRRRGDQG